MRYAFLSLSIILTAALFVACSSSEPESRQERDPKAFFSKMDSNDDGRLSWDEFKGMPSRTGDPEERFQRMDMDQDGYISLEEFMEVRNEMRSRDGDRQGMGGGRRGGGGRSGSGGF